MGLQPAERVRRIGQRRRLFVQSDDLIPFHGALLQGPVPRSKNDRNPAKFCYQIGLLRHRDHERPLFHMPQRPTIMIGTSPEGILCA
jgi:hypothetical protein